MSRRESKPRSGKSANGDNLVGYGKPPAEHRFVPGRSGNPAGRPRKPRGASSGEAGVRLGAQTRTSELILAEAYQPLKVRDGDGVTTLTATQAVLRGLLKNALSGSRLAQKDFLNHVNAVEAQRRIEGLELFKAALDYKERAEYTLADRLRSGQPTDDILPHPADIDIDPAGTLDIRGPCTPEERAGYDQYIALRDDWQVSVSEEAERYFGASTGEACEDALDHWHRAQMLWDTLNDRMPKSLQATLRDRSSAPGASRPGSARVAERKPQRRQRKGARPG